MTVSFERACNFVYQNGTLWERALFAYLFEQGTRARVWHCLGDYQNADGGWAHGLEHDIRTPSSNPATTEYVLSLMLDFGLAEDEPLQRTAQWVERTQDADGTLPWPADLTTYPHMPWWGADALGGSSWPPDALVGRLAALGYASWSLLRRTEEWAQSHLNEETYAAEILQGSQQIYRFYHYADYFLGTQNVQARDASAWPQRIVPVLVSMAEDKDTLVAGDLLMWRQRYPQALAAAIPQTQVDRHLDVLQGSQQEEGGWPNRHNLLQWRSIQTIWALKTLREFGRL